MAKSIDLIEEFRVNWEKISGNKINHNYKTSKATIKNFRKYWKEVMKIG